MDPITLNIALLSLLAFFTSAISATVGLGGGVILMLLMPGLLPLTTVIPIHAHVQLWSNVSRVCFGLHHVAWRLALPLLIGSSVGALMGYYWVDMISIAFLPMIAGIVILIVTWVPLPSALVPGTWSVTALGFYQTGLGMLAGATGPLGATVLSKINTEKEWLVINTGFYMTMNHGLRALTFGLLGFSFWQWWQVILPMSITCIVGSYVGTQLRRYLPQKNFALIFRWLITLLALRMMLLFISDGAP